MWVSMKVTGRLPAKKAATPKGILAAGAHDITRQARVTELRGLVSAKMYRVDSRKLAASILARALARSE
jgi:anti-sigma28 factor (negative regulator of flagellin synthesis)